MQQQLLEYIYLTYQPSHYFKTYLETQKSRPDSRSPSQHRPTRMSISPVRASALPEGTTINSLTITHNNTIAILTLRTQIKQCIYSPVTDSYGARLIQSICVTASDKSGRLAKNQRNWGKMIEEYVDQWVNWAHLEKQLVYNLEGKGLFGITGTLEVRVVSADGALEEIVLIGAQTLLWVAQFPKIQSVLKKNQNLQLFNLNVNEFWMGIKYAEVYSELLVDPTSKEQKNSSYQMTLVSDIRNPKSEITRIVKTNKSIDTRIADQIQKLYRVELSKMAFDIEAIRNMCQAKDNRGTIVVDINLG